MNLGLLLYLKGHGYLKENLNGGKKRKNQLKKKAFDIKWF